MTIQESSPFITEGKQSGPLFDTWPLVCQTLQGVLAVSQLVPGSDERTPGFGGIGTGLRPLFDATAGLVHSAEAVVRLLQSLPAGPLSRPFVLGVSLVELEGQNLSEFSSLLSSLCMKTSSACSWAVMLRQHNYAFARQISAEVAPLGSVSARVSRLHSGPATNWRALDEAIETLGVFRDSMNRLLEAGAR
jgi:hypothetical protein